jgi:hypothetical protein
MTVKAIITADCCYRVEGDSYEPQGNIYLKAATSRCRFAGQRAGTYLRTIDLCNDSQLIRTSAGCGALPAGRPKGR